jgi:hypothetical protein
MKFNNITGNPPFQDTKNRKKTQHKLWITFTEKAMTAWLEDDGSLLWITPSSWGSPSNKVLQTLKDNQVMMLNLDTKKHFPGVGSLFSHYRVDKKESVDSFPITSNEVEFDFSFDGVFYVPNDVCKQSLSIHKKVTFQDVEKFEINYDYVTCHNVIRHAFKLHDKKVDELKKKASKTTEATELSKINERLAKLAETRKTIDITISETQSAKHVYPVFHTNNKVWYSSIRQDFADKKKVMWSRSGYVKAFYDDGKYGCTDMGYYILVDSDAEGERLASFMGSELMTYIFKTAKWSGFGNEKVFSSIPKISLSKNLTDKEIYSLFGITDNEQKYIKSILNPPKKSRATKNAEKEIKSEERVKNLGEVFTPRELVLELLNELPEDRWSNPNETFIDPACGNGNFLVEIFIKRLDSNIDPMTAAETLYGIDIMPDNISECHKRIREVAMSTSVDMSEFDEVLQRNIVVGNSLEQKIDELFLTN